jgi:hypothetical protein
MPLQTVEELRYVKHKIKKRYGTYGEKVACAEHVKVMTSKGKVKERLVVIGTQRFYLFRKAILQDNVTLFTNSHHSYSACSPLTKIILNQKQFPH